MQVKIKKARLSFASLFEPEQYQGAGPFKYRASFLFEPNSQTEKDLRAAMRTIAKEEWKDKADAVLAAADDDSKLRFIVDGNKKTYDGYAGMKVITATRAQDKKRPLILDKKPWKDETDSAGNKIPNTLTQESGKPYSGCYVNAVVDLWCQSNAFGKTIRAQLISIQFDSDGDAFGAGTAKGNPDDYEDLSTDDDTDGLVTE